MDTPDPVRCPWCGMWTNTPHRTLEECIDALELELKMLKARVRQRDEATERVKKRTKS